MPAKQVLTLSQLLAVLKDSPLGPTDLALTTGTSLMTANRKLKQALAMDLVAKVGKGPATTYRVTTMEEQIALAQEGEAPPVSDKALKEPRVLMEMDVATAQLVQQALEMYARLGMGHFDHILELPRLGRLLQTDGSPVPDTAMDAAQAQLSELKTALTGLSAGAYYGLTSENVSPACKKAWDSYRAIRHRLAWDRNPEGGSAVDFDEPFMGPQARADIIVSSGARWPTPEDVLRQLPPGYFIGPHEGAFQAIGPNADGTALVVRGTSESPQTAVGMARNGARGAAARNFED